MSFDSWEEEVYPIQACQMVYESDISCTKHALTKWKGLRKEVLAKHELEADYEGDLVEIGGSLEKIAEGNYFEIDSSTCALCCKHSCETCPIVRMRGYDCYTDFKSETEISEYKKWCEYKDPEPMIDLLEKTLKYLEEEENDNT